MPYAPGIQPRGDMYIAQGAQQSAAMGNQALMAMAQDMIARGRQKATDQATLLALQDQGNDEDEGDTGNGADALNSADEQGQTPEDAQDAADLKGKKADALRKLTGLYHPQTAQAIKAMSLEELEGNLKAYTIGSAMQEHAAKMQEYQAQAAYRNQEATSDQQAGDWAKHFLSAPAPTMEAADGSPDDEAGQGPASAVAKFAAGSPEDFAYRAAYASGKVPNMGGRAWAKAATALSRFTEAKQGGRPAFFSADNPVQDLPGLAGYARVTTGPNTAQVVSKGGAQVQTIVDADGNTRTVLLNPRGGATALPAVKETQVPPDFNRSMDKQMEDYSTAEEAANDDTLKPAVRARAQKQLSSLQKRIKGTVDRYHSSGQIPDETRDSTYQQIGLQPPGAPAPAAATAAQLASNEVQRTVAGRVAVFDKNSKKFLRYAN